MMKTVLLILLAVSRCLGAIPLLYELSGPVLTPIPLPPDCTSTNTVDVGTPISVERFVLNSSVALMSGVIVWSEQVTTTCSVGFFGSEKKVVDKRVVAMLSLETLRSLSLVSTTEGEIKDLSVLPMFECTWPQTKTISTIRTYQKSISAYPTLHGGFTIDGVMWIPVEAKAIYRHQHRLFRVLEIHEQVCPLISTGVNTGVLNLREGSKYRISIPDVELQFNIEIDRPLQVCPFQHGLLYYTDLGFIIKTNLTSTNVVARQSVEGILLSNSAVEFSLRDAQLNYDLEEIQHVVNRNFNTLQSRLCRLRAQRWKTIVKEKDYDGMAAFVSGDLFAVGFLSKGSFFIQTRLLREGLSENEHFVYRKGSHIHWLNNGSWVEVESVSGIINPSREPLLLLPPLVPLDNGSYLNIETLSAQQQSGLVHLETLNLHELTREMNLVDEYKHWDNIATLNDQPTYHSNVFSDSWDWLKEEYRYAKILGGITIAMIVVYLFTKAKDCIGCVIPKFRSSPPVSPNKRPAQPSYIKMRMNRRV